ncbi:MAG: PHP domain-containing protein, partial [Pseudolabrys sp.]|nr:PHP domain-containing protein [Pseudolabrys sp.]
MPALDFVHLHVHSSYSLLEGALPISKLADLAKADKQPALALTDTDNMFGALEFSEKLAGYGIQPIIGCALAIDFADHEQRNGAPAIEHGRVVLLAAREEGYRALMRLNSRAFLETPSNEAPHLKLEWLKGETADIIALTGGPGGPIDRALGSGQSHLADTRLDALINLFGDRLYAELQRHGTAAEKSVEPALIELVYNKNLPLVATNEPYFAKREDYDAHDALICIAEGKFVAEGDRRQLTTEHRFKSRGEMVKLFADLPEALASTVEIAQRCSFRPRTHQPILPRFSVGDKTVDEGQELRTRAEAGLKLRLAAHGLAAGHDETAYSERLAFELDVIERMKYPGYFLIVSDFIQWAKSQGI